MCLCPLQLPEILMAFCSICDHKHHLVMLSWQLSEHCQQFLTIQAGQYWHMKLAFLQADHAVKQQEDAAATLANLRQQAQALEAAMPSEPLQTDAEILLGFAKTCKATTLNNHCADFDKPQSFAAAPQSTAPDFRSNMTFLEYAPSFSRSYSPEGRAPLQSSTRLAAFNGGSEGQKPSSAAKQAGQPSAHSHQLAISEQGVSPSAKAVPLTRDLVNVISHLRPEASELGVPRSLSPGSKALSDQAAPHLFCGHADSAAAAEDNMPIMHIKDITKQAAHPAAVPNSSGTQPSISGFNWKRLLPDSPTATGHPLLDAALRLNRSHEDSIIAKINYDNSRIAAESHKLPRGLQYPPSFQQLLQTDQDQVASNATALKQQQTNFSLSKDSFREVLKQPREPTRRASEQPLNITRKGAVAQSNESSAAVDGSSTRSAPPSGEHSHHFSLSYLF